MCGVFGYVTDRDEALGPILVDAARRLTYRGYDSVGAATFRDGAIDLRKDFGKVAPGRLRLLTGAFHPFGAATTRTSTRS